ncbi:MAG: hypothetical protein GXP04_14270 [Alphaproteobacteria bacterium]|nr:hypothetical protein [Alphaproteobacteria bacterium]
MSPIVMFHVTTGTIAVFSGAIALFSRKGERMHRAAGNLFFISMLAMAAAGAYRAIDVPMMISVLVGLFTIYLVATAWVTVMRDERQAGLFEIGALIASLAVSAGGAIFGLQALNSEDGLMDGFSSGPYFFFGGLALFSAVLDASMLIRGGLAGKQRIARHLWRMCFAFFIAAGSLFTGPGAKAFPDAIRETGILSAPEPLILLVMLFWLIRVLFTKWWRIE